MKEFFALLAPLAFSVIAHAEPLPFPTDWKKILVCDGGAAWVDVNALERRMLQVVIQDEEVIRQLRGRTCVDSPWYMDRPDQRCTDGKFIIAGQVTHGIFEPGQFQGFVNQGGTYTCHSGSASTLRVTRTGGELKVSYHQEAAQGCCWESDSDGNCVRRGPDVPALDLTSWTLRGCREI
jgi:hypothetical protein